MFPTISLGGAVIPTAPLIYLLGVYVTLDIVEHGARRLGQNGVRWYGIALTIVIAAILGARLAFVAQNLDAYVRQPLSLIWPLTAGFTPWAGIIAASIMALIQCRRYTVSGWQMLDIFAPAIAMQLGFIALADFVGGVGLGTPTTVPWGLLRVDVMRHPVQIYELLVSGVTLVAWWRLGKPGVDFGRIGLISSATYAAGRLFVDAYRANTPLVGAGYHLIQLLAFFVLLTSLAILALRANRQLSNSESLENNR